MYPNLPRNESRETTPSDAPLLPSINNEDHTLSLSLENLTIATASATSLPPSPYIEKSDFSSSYVQTAGSSSQSPRLLNPDSGPPTSQPLSQPTSPALRKKLSTSSLQSSGGGTSPRKSPSLLRKVSSSAMGLKSALAGINDAPEPPPHPTAQSVASAHFKMELEQHENPSKASGTETIIILHDSCYGHRFSRPKTSKAALSTIVERPERIHASILGLSVAYVRLGERHLQGHHPVLPETSAADLPAVPFRIRKTARRLAFSSQAVTNVHGTKWMEELKLMCDTAESKLAMNGKELTRPEMARSPDQEDPQKFHEGDLYLCSESLEAMEGALGAVCEGVDAVFEGSKSGQGPYRTFVAIRPPGHHCSASYPSGFCWLNNVHVGISHATLNHGLTHAAIIDFDLHHGDGSQAITWEHNQRATKLAKNAAAWKKTSIAYFSLHDINSYPCEYGDEEKVKNASLCIENAHGQNIWNVHLQEWKTEAEFWELYETRYSVLLEKTRNYLRAQTQRIRSSTGNIQPKAAIFLSAGFDASEHESDGMQRHKVNVPTEFYARLARDVVKIASEEGTSVDGRVISVLEGGYSDRALASGVLSHVSGLAGSDSVIIKEEVMHGGLGEEMAKKLENISLQDKAPAATPYDAQWWSVANLEHLDETMNPQAPRPEVKMVVPSGPQSTYSSPTQSFSAKIVHSPKPKRVTSSSLPPTSAPPSPRPVFRAPTPPPIDVDWATAAHELSKVLIPTDRQTRSCQPGDLSAGATKARRDRQSLLTSPENSDNTTPTPPIAPGATRVSLRERRAPKSVQLSAEELAENAEKAKARASRRKTLNEATDAKIPSKDEPNYQQPATQSSRRLSLSSNASAAAGTTTSGANSRGRLSSGSGNVPRTHSSLTIRPESSMSSRGTSVPPLAIKKARAAPVKRTENSKATKPTATTTKPPVPRVPSVHRTDSSHTPQDSGSDMDKLTSGMGRVRLSLTTKRQREERERAKHAAQVPVDTTPKAASGPSKESSVEPYFTPKEVQTPPETEAPAIPQPASNSPVENTSVSESVSTPVTEQPPTFQTPLAAAQIPIPDTPVVQFSPVTDTPQDNFIAYQPEGSIPAAAPIPAVENLRWLPPNTATPSPSKKELPVFTSSGVIPFAAAPAAFKEKEKENGERQGKGKKEFDKNVWEVPETPER